jgi:hypothetical protein
MRGRDRFIDGMREGGSVTVDLATELLVGSGRLLDRRRLDLLLGGGGLLRGGEPGPVLAAVDGAWPSVLDRCAGPSLPMIGR